jgi:hypothetical protein
VAGLLPYQTVCLYFKKVPVINKDAVVGPPVSRLGCKVVQVLWGKIPDQARGGWNCCNLFVWAPFCETKIKDTGLAQREKVDIRKP